MIVYLNGSFVPYEEARIPVDDRGFLFADGVYEVCRIYEGRIFLLEPHLRRMRYGLGELKIDAAMVGELPAIAEQLLERNGMKSADATLYAQVTRGAAPRAHAFPNPPVAPTVFVAVKPFRNHPDNCFEEGVGAVSVEDTRWSRCDIKSIALLPNVLANQQAKEKGAFEALFVRDGQLIEGSHSNLFGVLGGELLTYQSSGYILSGITRELVLEKAAELGIPVREAGLPLDRFDDIKELFLSGTTTEIMPIVRVDGRQVGDGRPGAITRQLRALYRSWIDEDLTAATSSHGGPSAARAS